MSKNLNGIFIDPIIQNFNQDEIKCLSVDQIKSRLILMDEELKMEKNPRKYYVDRYIKAINDPIKVKLLNLRLYEENKQFNLSSEKNKIESFLKKRSREENCLTEDKRKNFLNTDSHHEQIWIDNQESTNNMNEMRSIKKIDSSQRLNISNNYKLDGNNSSNIKHLSQSFKSPKNVSPFFKNEYTRACDSIKKLTGFEIENPYKTSSSNEITNNLNMQGQKSPLSDKLDIKKFLRFLLLSLSIGALTIVGYKYFSQKLPDINFAKFPFIQTPIINFDEFTFFQIANINFAEKNVIALIAVGCIAILIIAYLINQNKRYVERENKLIASNSFQSIKSHLINGGNSSIPVNSFVDQYCRLNNHNEEDFKRKILPHISELVKVDEEIEESQIYMHGSATAFWKIKS